MIFFANFRLTNFLYKCELFLFCYVQSTREGPVLRLFSACLNGEILFLYIVMSPLLFHHKWLLPITAFTAAILCLEAAVIDLLRPGRSLKPSLLPFKWLIQLYTFRVAGVSSPHTLLNSLESFHLL